MTRHPYSEATTMRQEQLQTWRSEPGSRRWLSMLVGAMEESASLELRQQPCPPSALEGLRAQLALPASPQSYPISVFSFRN
jgi:hypothetical protein